MPTRELRFGIHDGRGLRATTWKLWTRSGRGKSDFYLACRATGRYLKVSFHQSAEWRVAYEQSAFLRLLGGVVPAYRDRVIDSWTRPPALASGFTMALRIVTPSASVVTPIDSGDRAVEWIPNAPAGKATEILLVIAPPGCPRWNGNQAIGSLPIESGESIWVAQHTIDMPDVSGPLLQARPQFFNGSSKSDLEEAESLRMVAFGSTVDGQRVLYDLAVEYNGTALKLR
jgi:hypothetical protein